ncbi:MAG: hypothetical protein ACRYGL_19045, partial [Janthinobacterium lividum]
KKHFPYAFLSQVFHRQCTGLLPPPPHAKSATQKKEFFCKQFLIFCNPELQQTEDTLDPPGRDAPPGAAPVTDSGIAAHVELLVDIVRDRRAQGLYVVLDMHGVIGSQRTASNMGQASETRIGRTPWRRRTPTGCGRRSPPTTAAMP